ncbi:unnamed protein product [Cuscuta europaea]|uniref:Pectinesterase inhibitor domain-containing protein n=1 Tax=Cuscuta europaea TaxID=41803 RepID=A0A9P0ZY82_CUSEU|nr:unnamed protein product [Cuscuta europaea]
MKTTTSPALIIIFLFSALQLPAVLNSIRPPPCTAPTPAARSFINESCYSAQNLDSNACYQWLSSHVVETEQPRVNKLVKAAINLTMEEITSSVIPKINTLYEKKGKALVNKDKSIARTCLEMMDDSRGGMKDTLDQMYNLKPNDLLFQISNLQTWMSAALTNVDTCLDDDETPSVSDNDLRSLLMNSVGNVQKHTVIALSLINYFASKCYSDLAPAPAPAATH